jgi:hypothetical protein
MGHCSSTGNVYDLRRRSAAGRRTGVELRGAFPDLAQG